MRSFLSFALFVFMAASAVAAPASERSVEELLTITRTASLMESMYVNVEQTMRQGMQQATQGKTLTAEQQRILDGMPAKFVAVMREDFNWTKMKPLYVQLYRDTFEQDEVDGLVAFYQSTAGRAFVDKMPIVMQKSMALARGQMQSLMPKMKAAMEQALEEAKVPRQ
jgi:uncharacterized protein